MRCDVFKKTSDDWHPPYSASYGMTLVRVSLIKLITLPHHEHHWRVCVWGMDDCGMEKDFVGETGAWACFLEVIGLEDVTMVALKARGFVST